MLSRKMLIAGVGAVVIVSIGVVLAAIMPFGDEVQATGWCVDDLGDTYGFHDNGMFLPGSTLADARLKEPEDYVSWTVPTPPQEGSDIVSVVLIRGEDWLTVTAELADRWVPEPLPEEIMEAPGEPLRGSSVTVSLKGEELSGGVTIEDSPAKTIFRVGGTDTRPEDRREIAIDSPVFDGNRATVRIPAGELGQLGDTFEFSAWSSLVTAADVGILDDCPNQADVASLENLMVQFPNEVSPGDLAASSTAGPSSTSSTTSTSAPAVVQPASTVAPTTSPPECPRTWTEPMREMDLVAKCLYTAYREGDRDWAAVFADPEAVDRLFEWPWEPPEWQFDRCEENAAVPPYGYCYYWIEGEPHGVQVEMVMDGGVSAGLSVWGIEYYG